MRRYGAAVLFALAAGLGAAAAGMAGPTTVTEEPILATPANETQYSIAQVRGTDIVSWTQYSPGRVNDVAYLRRGSGTRMKLNLKGLGFAGDVSPPWVVYQQVDRSASDLKFYRLDRRRRVAAPAGVNTRHWEWRPIMNGRWLAFMRSSISSNKEWLILFNMRTRRQRVIATGIQKRTNWLSPAQIRGNWLVFERCNPRCNATLYNIGTRAKTVLAKPSSSEPMNNWSPAVTSTGVVYAGQGPDGCGNAVQLVRFRGPGDPDTGTPLYAFPDGMDLNNAFTRTLADGTVELYYTRVRCDPWRSDIYRILDPPAGTLAQKGTRSTLLPRTATASTETSNPARSGRPASHVSADLRTRRAFSSVTISSGSP